MQIAPPTVPGIPTVHSPPCKPFFASKFDRVGSITPASTSIIPEIGLILYDLSFLVHIIKPFKYPSLINKFEPAPIIRHF